MNATLLSLLKTPTHRVVCVGLLCATFAACTTQQESSDAVADQESKVTLTDAEYPPRDEASQNTPPADKEQYDVPDAEGLVPVGHAEPPRIPECEPPPDDVGSPPALPPARYEAQGAPEGTDELARALRVQHAEDFLPIDVFKEDPLSEDRLRYLSTHGELMVERQRALVVLQHFPSEATRLLLMQLAQQDGLHISIRTQALRSLREVMDADDARAQEVLDAARASDDARLQKAAGKAQKSGLREAKGSSSKDAE